MLRGDIWWARLAPPQGIRPVLLLSRDQAIQVRAVVTIAPLTRTVRGKPFEVALTPGDGVPKPSAVNVDSIQTIEKTLLLERICALGPAKMAAVSRAVKYALALDE